MSGILAADPRVEEIEFALITAGIEVPATARLEPMGDDFLPLEDEDDVEFTDEDDPAIDWP
ncbi:hypothetical protein ACFPZ0_21365 [Streptomonospora nanhaiensis]|uniref:Uncharacterized protein n=1 Tax=Streptomonospora nanhaiensis TaxID=1323731 RepID=A0A853BRM9_9ACTN|nr:hypothetical protein [Streptomonospora nanhaiensis]MBV2364322.1 hypothetical protein [Streptomonospora nanhaiensis]MBX9390578.1 hypothetical protein [Streptomonospora nanhaiensis]NYI97207.1 hypothetical protein [Streptomonospora nanhaiensis]